MSFGFEVDRVFGGNGKGKKKRKIGESVFGTTNGIPTFSTEVPELDVLGLGENFGEKIGREAGLANGEENFLRQIGGLGLGIPAIAGREPTPTGARRAKRARLAGRAQQPSILGLEGALFGAERRAGKVVGADVERTKQFVGKKVARFKARREAKKERQKAGRNGEPTGRVQFKEGTTLNGDSPQAKTS